MCAHAHTERIGNGPRPGAERPFSTSVARALFVARAGSPSGKRFPTAHMVFDVTHLPFKQKDKSDPLGQRGYVGAAFWSAALVVNGGWMGVIEVGRTSL